MAESSGSKMAGCVEEVKHAMRMSSLKGLPRIMAARGHLDRTIWTVAVICFICVCSVTVFSNVWAYLTYPKVVNVEEKLINQSDPNGTVPYPTVAVCNTNPFSSSKSDFEQKKVPYPKEYHSKVRDFTTCRNCSEQKVNFSGFIRRMLMTNRGYYQYAGMEAMVQMKNPDLVLQCNALIMSGSFFAAYPCEDFSKNYTFVHPDVGVCYAYEALPVKDNAFLIGYSFMLHLDNSEDNLNTEFDAQFMPQPRSGAIIYTFDPYIVPMTMGSSTMIAPGMANTLYVKMIRTDRLSKPYSDRDCIDVEDHQKVFYNNRHFNYDALNCLGECTVEYTIKKCNCTDLFLLQRPETEAPKYEYCASLRQPEDVLYEKMKCAEEAKNPGYIKCMDNCLEPCKEIKYVLRTTVTKWPLPSQLGSFYNNVIKNHTNLHRTYKEYDDIVTDMNSGVRVSPLNRSLVAKLVEDNFGLVTIYLSDFYYTHYESKPKITIDALISQLGGSLNLWSGITVMILVELLDLIIKILGQMRSRPEDNKDTSTQARSSTTDLNNIEFSNRNPYNDETHDFSSFYSDY